MNDVVSMTLYFFVFSFYMMRYYDEIKYKKFLWIIPIILINFLMVFRSFIYEMLFVLIETIILSYIPIRKKYCLHFSFLFFNINAIFYVFFSYVLQFFSFLYIIIMNEYSNVFEIVRSSIYIIIPLFSYIVMKWLKDKTLFNMNSLHENRNMITIFNILILCGNIALYWLYNEGFISVYIFLIFIVYIIIIFLLAFYFNKELIYKEKSRDDSFINSLQERVEDFMISYQKEEKEIRSIKHDIKNHLSIIKHLENKGDINQYINKVLPVIDNLDVLQVQLTGNVYLDAILYSKMNEFPNISLKWDIHIDELKIDDVDLCVLIFNLLDNACHAASEVNGEVKLKIHQDDFHLFIKVSNTCFDGLVANKKINDSGLGLKIINSIVNKYNGKMEIDTLADHVNVSIGLTLDE